MSDRVVIPILPTGVPGLDPLLGGGLPELSFNLLAGPPGSGKTTLAHQIMFELASNQRKALFFTVLGEPALKMLRYQQQYSFFDVGKLNECIRFVNLGEEVQHGSYDRVLSRIAEEVERFNPGLVFVDSFRSAVRDAEDARHGVSDLQHFVQRLGTFLTSWQATTFLIGEYASLEQASDPIFTIADGILWLGQFVHRDSMVRKLQATKIRGRPIIPGLHTFRITDDGLQVFPRVVARSALAKTTRQPDAGLADDRNLPTLSMGVPEVDRMMGGGLPLGYSLLISGPSGSGKSTLATAFLAEGAAQGEKGVVAAFESTPGSSRNRRLDALVRSGEVAVVETRLLDLSVDEAIFELAKLVRETGATRVVIDSLSAFELALAPAFRDDFREALHRLVAVLSGLGASVVMLSELEDRYTDLRFSPYGAAFLSDAIIVQRYVELEGQLQRVMGIVKIRNRPHSHGLRLFTIDDDGLQVGPMRPDMEAMMSGHPRPSLRDPDGRGPT